MTGNLLRKRDGGHARVGFVELFFDLVFVFAITQISHGLLEHLTWLGALQSAMLLMAVWWAWVFTSWVTNWLDPDRGAVQAALFVLMGAGLVMSAALPRAFEDRGLAFGAAFAFIQVGRSLFVLWAVRGDQALFANFVRIAVWLGVSAVFWIWGGLVSPEQRLGMWAVALAVEYLGPILFFYVPGLGRSRTSDWSVEGAHLAERVGLFVIICLGETLLITGATFAGLTWTAPVILAFVSAVLSTIAMWRLYFSRAHEAGSEAIHGSDDPGRLARRAYTYAPLLVVAAIIVVAVSDELVIAHPEGHVATATALTLIGGPILFLISTCLGGLAVWGRWMRPRLVGVAALALLWPLSPQMTPLTLSWATTIILLAVGAWETLAYRAR
ncbi:MAG: low temperature requirement protein A [Caulobacterales bacterium]|nr:low temperature requirement protein A [Caulobacterales bacterium]